MSLFKGLFSGGGGKESTLFKNDSQFRAKPAKEPGQPQKASKQRKSNKRARENDEEKPVSSKRLDTAVENVDVQGPEAGQDSQPVTLANRPLTKSELKEREALEDEKMQRTIFVGNLCQKPKLQKKIKTLFSQFGTVESTRIRSAGVAEGMKLPKKAAFARGETGNQGTCNAYVVFKDKESVKPALKMNMTLYDGYHMRVDRSTPPRHKPGALFVPVFDEKTSVFIHNLVPEVLDEDIIDFFSDQNIQALKESIVAVRLIRDQRLRQCKGIGYVKFKTRKAVTEALKLSGSDFQGRKLKVNRVKPSNKPRESMTREQGSDKKKGQRKRHFERKSKLSSENIRKLDRKL